jgi:hypothetical protein
VGDVTQFPCRFPAGVVEAIDAARLGASRNAWLLEAARAVLDGRVVIDPPPVVHAGGRRVLPNGLVDRLPSDLLEARARAFQVGTSKKGGPANRPSYPAKKEEK